MTLEVAQLNNMERGSRRQLTMLVYAVLFLILTGSSFTILSAIYSRHLVSMKQYHLLWSVTQYSDLAQVLFCSLQLIVILFFFRPLRRILIPEALPSGVERSAFNNATLGFLAGFIGLLVVFPGFLVRTVQPSPAIAFLVDNLYSVTSIGLLLVLVFVLPVLSEAFFRGVLLRQLLESTSTVSAMIVSILLFTLWWPTYSLVAGALLGLVTGLLFYRTRSILACIIANSFFTIGLIVLQLWRSP